jgi:hypothetical protein
MPQQRALSFIAIATEIVCALGFGARRSGRTFFLVFLALTACGRELGAVDIQRVSFSFGRAEVALSEPVKIAEISVTRPGGGLLLRRDLAGRRGRAVRLDFPWRPGGRYTFRLRTSGGRAVAKTVRAPERELPPLALSLEIPHGSASPRTILPAGAAFQATLKATAGRKEAGGFRVRLRLPAGVETAAVPPGVEIRKTEEGTLLLARGATHAPNDLWFRQFSLRLTGGAKGPLAFEAKLIPDGGATPPLRASAHVQIREAGELARFLAVEKTRFPTDQEGEFDAKRVPGIMYLPGGPGHFLQNLLGGAGPPPNPFVPFRHQTVWIRNRAEGALAVAATARILSLETGAPVNFLRAPGLISGGTGRSSAFAVLPPGRLTPVVLPFYFDPRGSRPGQFRRRIEVRLWGAEANLITLDLPLELRRPSLRAFLFTAGILGLGILGSLLLFWNRRRLSKMFPLRVLAGASTFAAVITVLAGVPELILGNLLTSALGPFAFLISGLFTAVPVYAIGVAFLMRYPVPGALGLLIGIRRLILALTIYSLQLLPLLMLIAEVITLESAAWLAGVTRGGPGGRLFDRWPRERWRPLLVGGAAFVAADTLITAASFHLHIFFFRLVYADWYIVLFLAVSSVLYTFLGVALGLRLGGPLREVAG